MEQKSGAPVLVMGILSLVFCWLYGIPGIIFAIIGLVLAGKRAPVVGAAKAGKILSIIGLILSILWFVIYVVIIGVVLGNM